MSGGDAAETSNGNSAETVSGGSSQTGSDPHAVKVKSEYVLSERHPLLAAESPDPRGNSGDNNGSNNGSNNNGDNNGNNRGKQNRKKSRGMNKKRPRDAKIASSEKACLATIRGEVCPYGKDRCKYNHDLKELLANRPEDIKEVDGGCPFWRLRGYCHFGLMCRLGSCHINTSTGQNLHKDVCVIATTKPPDATNDETDTANANNANNANNSNNSNSANEPDNSQKKVMYRKSDVKNVIAKETIDKLRKNKYPFVCKRHFEIAKKPTKKNPIPNDKSTDKDNDNNDTKKPEVIDLTTPLPSKRKLIDFSNKVYIAPLTTVGNLPFRRVLKHYGADITCGEMALADQLLQGKTSEWALLKRHPSEDVFGVQIAAGFPDLYTRVAEVLANPDEGIEVDFVDLNLGCPIDLVCDKGAGASLMLREKKLKGILEGMTRVLPCPVTIKMRTGWDESRPVAHSLIRSIHSWGMNDSIGAIMIHGRSRLQRYSKLANWDYIGEIASGLKDNSQPIPIIGNGDIFSYTDYEEKIAKFANEKNNDENGVNTTAISPTAMLGRGALIKPWLPTEIKERRHYDISATERLDMLKEFVKFGLEHWGSDQQGVNNTRRYLLEWLSFLHRYVPVGLLEVVPQMMNQRPPNHMCGRNDLETLMLSKNCADWIKISEMLLGPVPDGFQFEPKHKANSYK